MFKTRLTSHEKKLPEKHVLLGITLFILISPFYGTWTTKGLRTFCRPKYLFQSVSATSKPIFAPPNAINKPTQNPVPLNNNA